jgi:hypothetical protein
VSEYFQHVGSPVIRARVFDVDEALLSNAVVHKEKCSGDLRNLVLDETPLTLRFVRKHYIYVSVGSFSKLESELYYIFSVPSRITKKLALSSCLEYALISYIAVTVAKVE